MRELNLNSIESIPSFDKNLLEDWKKRRINTQRLINQRPVTPLKKIETLNFDAQYWKNRKSTVQNNTQNSDPKEIKKEGLNISSPEEKALPQNIFKKYVEINGKYYFHSNTKKLAFVDKGKKISTSLVDKDVAKSMVDIAKTRNWSKILLKGKKEFRREVWLEAQSRGLKTKGYNPSEQDYAELKTRVEYSAKKRFKAPRSNPKEPLENQTTTKDLNIPNFKTLVSYGTAPYQDKPKNKPSYYAELKDNKTEEVTKIWGTGIKQALKSANAKQGDKIILKKLNPTQVTITKPIKDEKGKAIDQKKTVVDRNNWRVIVEPSLKKEKEHAELIRTKNTVELAKNHPELKNEIVALEIAEKFSKQSSMSKKDGRRFFEQVRETIARGTSQGDSPPEVKIYPSKQNEREVEHEHSR